MVGLRRLIEYSYRPKAAGCWVYRCVPSASGVGGGCCELYDGAGAGGETCRRWTDNRSSYLRSR